MVLEQLTLVVAVAVLEETHLNQMQVVLEVQV